MLRRLIFYILLPAALLHAIQNPDSSVFVNIRPGWDDFKSYLTANGRQRFKVYVCTMAGRDYALEIWRLLDPEAYLISSEELSERLVCVKPSKFWTFRSAPLHLANMDYFPVLAVLLCYLYIITGCTQGNMVCLVNIFPRTTKSCIIIFKFL